MTSTAPEKIEVNIQRVTDPKVFSNGFVAVEGAAFAGGALDLMHPPHPLKPSPADLAAFSAATHATFLATDPSAVYCVATLPPDESKGGEERVVGVAKWNFFIDEKSYNPWPTTFAPGTNEKFVRWFFDALSEKRNEALRGKKHVLMAVLAIHPDYQKRGIGGKLLDWGLERCDREGLECWIDASKKGKGLYLKHGWVQVDSVVMNLGEWGGKEGATDEIACMLRQPKPVAETDK